MDVRRAYHRYVPRSIRTTVRRARGRGAAPDSTDVPRSGSASSGFEAAVRKLYERPDGSPVHPMHETWLNYALETNARGEEVARTVSEFSPLVGRRHLDIGSAYGGTVLAFAARGATSMGVEIVPSLLKLSRINAADFPGVAVEMIEGDILDEDIHSGLGTFDIITCEHVIEHVSDVRKFLGVLSGLLGDHGLGHLLIPNPFNPKEVAGDGHYGLFGLTILERDVAEAYFHATGWNEEYGVGEYCFTYRDHEMMFREAGMFLEQIYPPEDVNQSEALEEVAGKVRGLASTFESKVASGEIPPAFVENVRLALGDYAAGFERAHTRFLDSSDGLRRSIGRDLLVQYGQDAWYVIAYKELGPAINAVGDPRV
ncbi:MAG TPA: methyltransferase domain-containing protein [Acidimicrobiia bacterium]|nr:methyltransferase domain-containing protein [Acidimicrobiia bacterium]